MRWKKRILYKAFQKWWSEVRRSRVARRAMANFLRKALCRAWRTWEDNVDFFGKSECSCANGVCPICGIFFGAAGKWDNGSWEQAMNDHEQIERELLSVDRGEGGFVGLQVTEVPPHTVKQVNDLVDKNFIVHNQPGYSNPQIIPGDRILKVDGKYAEHADLDTLHRLLKGPLHSTVVLSLARAGTGEEYEVEALRHGKFSFTEDKPNGQVDNKALAPPMSDLLKDVISHRSASLYSSQRSAADLYNSQRSDRSVSDFYNAQGTGDHYASEVYSSQRSFGSGRTTPDTAGSSSLGFPSQNARVLTSKGETDGVITSNRAPTTRFE